MVLDFPSVVRQFWGRAAGRPAIRRGTLVFWAKKSGQPLAALLVSSLSQLSPVVVPIPVMVAISVATVVVVPVFYFVAVPIVPVAIAISIPVASYLPAAIDPPVISVAVVSTAVVSVMIIPDAAVSEARVLAEASFVLASPFPIFPLALTVQPVVLDIVIPALCQPLPVIRIVVSVVAFGTVIASGAIIGIISPIPVLRASGRHDCSQSQS